MVTIKRGFLSNEQKSYIDFILNGNLSLFYYGEAVRNDNCFNLRHNILSRYEDGGELSDRICSDYFDFFLGVVQSFVGNKDIAILRMAINGTFKNQNAEGAKHLDHNDIDHTNIVIALNDDFIGGGTAIYSGSKREVISLNKFEGCEFSNTLHATIFPEEGLRFVFVCTYTERK